MTKEDFERIIDAYIGSRYSDERLPDDELCDNGLVREYARMLRKYFVFQFTEDKWTKNLDLDPAEIISYWGVFVLGYTEASTVYDEREDVGRAAAWFRAVTKGEYD